VARLARNSRIHVQQQDSCGNKNIAIQGKLRPRPKDGIRGKKMRKIQEEAKAELRKAQEEMKKFVDRKRGKGKEYKVEDLVLLSMKDLKWQMKGRRLEKLTEHFIGPYKIKGIVFSNAIELELPKTIKIHSVVNVSRIRLYKPQVEGQKKVPPKLVIIEREEEFKVERILNKRVVWGKEKFLVRWKGYTAEEDTWESRENLENVKELVEEFEREYGKEAEELRRQELEEEEKEFSRELPREFTAKLLYSWGRKRYEREREKRWDEN